MFTTEKAVCGYVFERGNTQISLSQLDPNSLVRTEPTKKVYSLNKFQGYEVIRKVYEKSQPRNE